MWSLNSYKLYLSYNTQTIHWVFMDFREDKISKSFWRSQPPDLSVRNLTPLPTSHITLDICKRGVLGDWKWERLQRKVYRRSTDKMCWSGPSPFWNVSECQSLSLYHLFSRGWRVLVLVRIAQRGVPLYRRTIFSFSERSLEGVLFVLRYWIRKNKICSH